MTGSRISLILRTEYHREAQAGALETEIWVRWIQGVFLFIPSAISSARNGWIFNGSPLQGVF
jgi:hypothetical protein